MIGSGKSLDDYLGKIVPGPPNPPEGTANKSDEKMTCGLFRCRASLAYLALPIL